MKPNRNDNPRLPHGALGSRSLEGWSELALQGQSGVSETVLLKQPRLVTPLLYVLPAPCLLPCAHENLANAQLLTLPSAPGACPHWFAVPSLSPFPEVSLQQGRQSEVR